MRRCCSCTRTTSGRLPNLAPAVTVGVLAFRTSCFGRDCSSRPACPASTVVSAEFEDTVERVDRLVPATGRRDRAGGDALSSGSEPRALRTKRLPQVVSPPCRHDSQLQRQTSERTAICFGRWSRVATGARPFLTPQVVLTPAACYPVYPTLAGDATCGGRLVDVMSYCFRHEPSEDAARMQMFRMHEHIRAADARDRHWRGARSWLERVQS